MNKNIKTNANYTERGDFMRKIGMTTIVPLLVLFLINCGNGKIQNDFKSAAFGPILSYQIKGTASGISSTFADNVVLQNNGGDDLTISADGEFVFTTPIDDGNTYEVTLLSKPASTNCSMIKGSGTVLGADVTDIKLVCSDKGWGAVSYNNIISPGGSDAEIPQVAMNASGDAVVAWVQYDYNDYETIFKAELTNGVWSLPTKLTDKISPTDQNSWHVRVAMDDSGDAIIVWRQNNGSNDMVYEAERRSGTWTYPKDLTDSFSPTGQSTNTPVVAMDNNGNAIVAWYQYNGSNYMIYVREYRSGSWSTMPDLAADNFSPTGQNVNQRPRVAMDDNGNAIVAWYQSNGSNSQIYLREYRSSVWSAIPDLATGNFSPTGYDAYQPEVSMDNNGDAVVIWQQYNSSGSEMIFKREYRSGDWSAMPDLSADFINPSNGYNAWGHHVAIDNNGNAIIAWCQSDSDFTNIYKSEYRNGSWVNPSSDTDYISPWGGDACYGDGAQPDLQMDNNGNAVITWQQVYGDTYDGNSNIRVFKSEYRSNTWINPKNIHDDVTQGFDSAITEFYTPRVAMSDNGSAILVWYGYDQADYYQIFMSEFK